MPVYIIEHLEPFISRWCLIEYKHISKIVGKDNLWITNVKKGSKELEKYAKIIKESVKQLALKDSCILDPDSNTTLAPKDSKKFRYFIFGGILGDYPPKKRTRQMLTKFIKNPDTRNIGKKQMSTDNAVYVVKQINHGIPLEKIQFKQGIEIETGKNESVMLPYRYVLVEGKPLISEELIDYLKRKRTF